jgi:hypothetical protein
MVSVKEIFSKICRLLNEHDVDYIVIGGLAVANYGFARNTADIDFWYKPTTENYLKIIEVFEKFGIDVSSLKDSVFDPEKSYLRFPVGVNVEFLPTILGTVPYTEARSKSTITVLDGLEIPMLNIDHLIQNKRATGRPIDKIDVEELLKRKDTNRNF